MTRGTLLKVVAAKRANTMSWWKKEMKMRVMAMILRTRVRALKKQNSTMISMNWTNFYCI